MRTWAWLASMGLALGLVACGDDGGGGTGGEGGGTSDGGGGAGTGATGTGATGTGATGAGGSGTGATGTGATGAGGGGTGECADEPTEDDCFDCCDLQEEAAFDELNTIFIDLCVCGAGAPCETDCATECADPNAMLGAACDACLTAVNDPNNPDQCVLDTIDDCVASATCSPILDCWGTC